MHNSNAESLLALALSTAEWHCVHHGALASRANVTARDRDARARTTRAIAIAIVHVIDVDTRSKLCACS